MSDLSLGIKALFFDPIVLLIISLVSLFFLQKKAARISAGSSLLIFLILSLPFTESKIAQYWEKFPPLNIAELKQFLPQAIVLIGGGLESAATEYQTQGTVKPGTLLRVRYAARLVKETGLPLLVSGGKSSKSVALSEAELMTNILQDEFGVPVAWQEAESLNTAENALFSHQILEKLGVSRIILVTQAYHMPRAEAEFRKIGFMVMAAPTAYFRRDFGWRFSDFLPSVSALQQAFLFIHETVGMFWYSIK